MRPAIASVFESDAQTIEKVRASDPAFDEMCREFECLVASLEKRFGAINAATADIIASFDELRREIDHRIQSQVTRGTD